MAKTGFGELREERRHVPGAGNSGKPTGFAGAKSRRKRFSKDQFAAEDTAGGLQHAGEFSENAVAIGIEIEQRVDGHEVEGGGGQGKRFGGSLKEGDREAGQQEAASGSSSAVG